MAKPSLFSKSQQPAPSNLPALPSMGGNLTGVKPPEPTGAASGYVFFAGQKSPKWPDLAEQFPGLQQNDAILISPDADPIRLGGEVRYFLLDAIQYWGQLDGQFHLQRAWMEAPEKQTNGVRVHEYLSLLVLVEHGGELFPATMRVSDAMCQAPYESVRIATDDATKPEWAQKSPDHAASLSIQQPNLRFKTHMTWKPRKSRGNYTYFQSVAKIHPTSAGDAQMLAACAQDAGKKELLAKAQESFGDWKETVASKV